MDKFKISGLILSKDFGKFRNYKLCQYKTVEEKVIGLVKMTILRFFLAGIFLPFVIEEFRKFKNSGSGPAAGSLFKLLKQLK